MRDTPIFFLALFIFIVLGSSGNAQGYTENDAQGLNAAFRGVSGSSEKGSIVFIDDKVLAQKIKDKAQKQISFNLVDLRLETDYGLAHIPGAVNIPLKKLKFVAEQVFDKSEEIIFYGYSEDDKAAVNSVIFLANKGFKNICLLQGGIKQWKGLVE